MARSSSDAIGDDKSRSTHNRPRYSEQPMTRFKELERIEAAIEHRDEAELRWAESYCPMRLGIASRKDHQKHWHNLQHKVAAVISELAEPSDSK
jgi:hypothetical protein